MKARRLEEAKGVHLMSVGVVAAPLCKRHRPEIELDYAPESRTEAVIGQGIQEPPSVPGFRGLQVIEGHPVNQLCLQTAITGHHLPPPPEICKPLRLLDRRELDFHSAPQRFGKARENLL